MKSYYPAVFVREEKGAYSVKFPDFPEAITEGKNFNDAVSKAEQCLGMCITSKQEIPSPSFDKINLNPNELLVMVEYDSVKFNK